MWTLAIVVAGLLGTGLPRVEAGQAPASRAERLRRETDNAVFRAWIAELDATAAARLNDQR